MFKPENEQGVIVVFAEQAKQHGFEIQSIGIAFPDALIEKDGVVYRTEFEFEASSFDAHKHDHRKCDLIICWHNDCPDSVLPILALDEPTWHMTDLGLPSDAERAAHYWRRRAQRAERSLRSLRNANDERMAALQENGKHICEICGRAFQTVNALNGHMNKHRAKGAQP